jgi:NAD-dependent dihydropyrimidine dehydrogenase PreA subunit
VREDLCTGCGFCVSRCPAKAISIEFPQANSNPILKEAMA